jgi:hypothetical protein
MPIHFLQWHRTKQWVCAPGQLYRPHVALPALHFQFDDTAHTVFVLAPIGGVNADCIKRFQLESFDNLGGKGKLGRARINGHLAFHVFSSICLRAIAI